MRLEDSAYTNGTNEDRLKYAGFWLRFGSMFLDGLLTMPLLLLIMLNKSRLVMIVIVVFAFIFEVFYEVYLVRRFGGTPGKLIMELRILKTDGSPVGYREALLRGAPDVIFNFLGSIGLLIALSKMTDVEYGGFLNAGFYSQLVALSPAWCRGVSIVERIWNWGELIVLQTNRKKRALHDFIAGTVVVQFAKPAGSAIDPTPFPSEGV